LTTEFELKRERVIREWKKLHNEELHDFYYSLIFIRLIKPRRMRYVGYAALMKDRRGGNVWERDHFEDQR
jgi:hypothetical protein